MPPFLDMATRRRTKLMQGFGTSMLVCTPSYALYLVDLLAGGGVNPAPWPEARARQSG